MSQTPGQFFEEIVELINLNWHKYNLRSKLIELLIAHDAEVRAETLQEERREILERADGMDAVWIRGWLVSRLHGAAKHLPDPHYRERIKLEARIAGLERAAELTNWHGSMAYGQIMNEIAKVKRQLAALDAPKGDVKWSHPELHEVDPKKLEYLKVWFATFCAIIEPAGPGEPEISDSQIVGTLRELREVIRRDAKI